MKIENISEVDTPITLQKSDGSGFSLLLKPGHFIFADNDRVTNSLRVQERKRNIKNCLYQKFNTRTYKNGSFNCFWNY